MHIIVSKEANGTRHMSPEMDLQTFHRTVKKNELEVLEFAYIETQDIWLAFI